MITLLRFSEEHAQYKPIFIFKITFVCVYIYINKHIYLFIHREKESKRIYNEIINKGLLWAVGLYVSMQFSSQSHGLAQPVSNPNSTGYATLEVHSGFFGIEILPFMCSPPYPFLSPRQAPLIHLYIQEMKMHKSHRESFFLSNPMDLFHRDITWYLCGICHCCLFPSEIFSSIAFWDIICYWFSSSFSISSAGCTCLAQPLITCEPQLGHCPWPLLFFLHLFSLSNLTHSCGPTTICKQMTPKYISPA